MVKNYVYTCLLFGTFALASSASFAQVGYAGGSQNKTTAVKAIDNLSIYPNPVLVNGKITIETKANEAKEIEIYNVVGKKIFSTYLNTKELVLPNTITAGIYIIKIKENNATATRKLIVK